MYQIQKMIEENHHKTKLLFLHFNPAGIDKFQLYASNTLISAAAHKALREYLLKYGILAVACCNNLT